MGFPRPIGGNRQCNWLCVSTRHCSSNPSGLFFPTLVVNLHERQYLAEYLMEILCRSPGLFPRQLSVFFLVFCPIDSHCLGSLWTLSSVLSTQRVHQVQLQFSSKIVLGFTGKRKCFWNNNLGRKE